MKYELEKIAHHDLLKDNWVITIKSCPNWFERVILRIKKEELQFVGDGTVWYRLPEVWRCSSGFEWMLSNFQKWAEVNGYISAE